jgi:hypothetical protein
VRSGSLGHHDVPTRAGVGLTVAGVALLRRGRDAWPRAVDAMAGPGTGRLRVLPAEPGYLRILYRRTSRHGGWMLLYTLLGYGLMRVRDDR